MEQQEKNLDEFCKSYDNWTQSLRARQNIPPHYPFDYLKFADDQERAAWNVYCEARDRFFNSQKIAKFNIN